MAFTGMDIQAVRTLANQMNQRAGEIRQLMGQLTSQLNNTPWVGPDREHFLSDWHSAHCQQLNAVIQGLEHAAQRAMQNAQEQENVSNNG